MGNERSQILRYLRNDTAILLGLASLTFLVHIFVSAFTDYGYYIDEFYYIACSKRLAFGYVDHPPLSILLLAINRWILGDSLPALRFLPALAIAVTVFLTGLTARKLGGGIAAQGIAALGTVIAPAYLVFGGFYSMNPFELLLWTTITYLIIKIIQEENHRLWLVVGVLMGLGLETKHTMILYAVGLGIGMVFTPARRYLWNRWFVYGCLIAFLVLLPNLVWQILNGFPSLEFYRNAMIYKNIATGPLDVLIGQIIIINPATLPLLLLGLLFFFSGTEGRQYRAFGWAYVIVLLVMIASQSSRPDRIIAVYTTIFAAGAVAVERYAAVIHRRWPVIVLASLLAVGGIVNAPICVPLLPPATLVRYMSAIGFSLNMRERERLTATSMVRRPVWMEGTRGRSRRNLS